MSNSILHGTGNPSCANDLDIAIQVTGIKHTTIEQYQSLELEFSSKKSSISPASYLAEEKFIENRIPSTIFKWEKENYVKSENPNLILQIKTQTGSDIKLPVIENFIPNGSNLNIDKYYLTNRLYAITPITNIGTFDETSYFEKSQVNIKQLFVTCRIGYLYIFLKGKLWRELFITEHPEEKTNQFSDVDLEQYRTKNANGTYNYTKDERNAIGMPLKDIWIPGEFYQHINLPINIFYSDVPLSKERIEYYEKNNNILNKRAPQFVWQTQKTNSCTDMSTIENGQAFPLLTSILPEMRVRDEGIEFLLEQPYNFLTKNDYISEALKSTQELDNLYTNPPELPTNKYTKQMESSAWKYLLLSSNEDTQEKTNSTEEDQIANNLKIEKEQSLNILKDLWTIPPVFEDITSNSRKRGILGVLIADPNYTLNRLKQLIKEGIQLFPLFVSRASNQEYHKLASFLEKQRNIITDTSFLKQMKDINSTYNKAVARGERERLAMRFKSWQANITVTLKNPITEEVFADMLSNYKEPFDIIGHFNHLIDLLFLSSISRGNYDPLASPEKTYNADQYEISPEKFIYDIFINKQHKLHQIIWPKTISNDIEKPYDPHRHSSTNNGDGVFNAKLWEKIVKEDSLKEKPTNCPTWNGIQLVKLLQYMDPRSILGDDIVPYFKTSVQILFEIINKANLIVEDAKKITLIANKNYNEAETNLNIAKQKLKSLEQDINTTIHAKEETKLSIRECQKQIEQYHQQLEQLANDFEEKLHKANVVKAKINIEHIEMIRIASDKKLYNLEYKLIIPENIFNGKIRGAPTEYRVLGIISESNIQNKPKSIQRKFSLFEDELRLSHTSTAGQRKSTYVAIIPASDPFIKLRDDIVTSRIPELEENISKNHVNKTILRDQLLELIDIEKNKQNETTHFRESILEEIKRDETNKGTVLTTAQKRENYAKKFEQLANKIKKTGLIMPPIMLALELSNIKIIVESYDKDVKNKGEVRTQLGLANATASLMVSTLAVIEQTACNTYLLAKLPKQLQKFVWYEGSAIAREICQKVIGRVALPISILELGLNIDAMIQSAITGNNATWGYIVLTGASVAGLLSILSASSPILSIGPIGWLIWGLILTIIGAILVTKLEDSDLEKWFKQGPFGSFNKNLSLINESDAFAALLNILIKPEISFSTNPYQKIASDMLSDLKYEQNPSQLKKLQENKHLIEKIAESNTCICITHGFESFKENNIATKFQADFYIEIKTTKIDTKGKTTSSSAYGPNGRGKIFHIEETPNGIILFAYTPEQQSPQYKFPSPKKQNNNHNDKKDSEDRPKEKFKVAPFNPIILSIMPLSENLSTMDSSQNNTDGYETIIENTYYIWVIGTQIQVNFTELKENKTYYYPSPTFTEKLPYKTKHNKPDLEKFLKNSEDQEYWFIRKYYSNLLDTN